MAMGCTDLSRINLESRILHTTPKFMSIAAQLNIHALVRIK